MTTIFFNNLHRIFRSWPRVVILVVLPLIFMNIFIPKSHEVPIKVALVDQDGTALTAVLRSRLEGPLLVLDMNEADVLDALINNEVSYSLIVRQGFTAKFLAGESPSLEGQGLQGPNVSAAVKGLLNSLLSSLEPIARASQGNEATFNTALTAFTNGTLRVEKEEIENASRPRTIGVLGFLVQFLIYMSVATSGLMLEERNNGSWYRIFSAPVSVAHYMAGHLLSALAVGIVQVTSLFMFLRFAMGVYFGNFFLSLLVLYIVFSAVCIAMGLLVTSYCKNPRQAYITIMLLATPLVMLGGAYWPRNFMPEVLVRISNLLPTTWVVEATHKLVYGSTLRAIAPEIGILLAFGAVFFAGGVMRKVDIAK